MGIYPDRRTHSHNVPSSGVGEIWIEEVKTPGLLRRRSVIAGPWIEERTDCFCCSCGDREGDDGACRDHGGYGRRPCERHDMPGLPWQDTEEMPDSVQEHIRKRREKIRDGG